MKIFKMNDCDWVAAENLDEAIQCLSDTIHDGTVDDKFKEEFIEDPAELTDAEMDKYTMGDEDAQYEASQKADQCEDYDAEMKKYYGSLPTFRQALSERLKTEKGPFFFASSEY